MAEEAGVATRPEAGGAAQAPKQKKRSAVGAREVRGVPSMPPMRFCRYG